jgi:hypothetical protein
MRIDWATLYAIQAVPWSCTFSRLRTARSVFGVTRSGACKVTVTQWMSRVLVKGRWDHQPATRTSGNSDASPPMPTINGRQLAISGLIFPSGAAV